MPLHLGNTKVAYQGQFPSVGPGGRPLDAGRMKRAGRPLIHAFACVELRGDWKWHMEVLGLRRNYKCLQLCHWCDASARAGPEQNFV